MTKPTVETCIAGVNASIVAPSCALLSLLTFSQFIAMAIVAFQSRVRATSYHGRFEDFDS